MRRLRRVLKIFFWTGFAVLVLAFLGSAGFVHYLRTPAGRARLVAFTLEKVRPFFPGGIKLGAIDGDYTSNLVLYDVELDDREHRPAVAAKRLELRYSLYPLLAGQVAVQSIDLIGGLVVSRPLKDGRDNLGTMVEAPRTEGQTKPVTSLPVAIDVERLDVEARFVRLGRGMTIDEAPHDTDVRGIVRASASVSRSIDVRVGELTVDLVRPALARIEAHGTIDCLKPVFHNVWARVRGEASDVHRYVEQLDLHGPAIVTALVDGTLDDLQTRASVEVPHHELRLTMSGRLGKTRARIDALRFSAPFAKLETHGIVHFDGHFDGAAKLAVTDLSKLRAYGAPPLSGKLTLDAQAAWDKRSVRVKAHVTGDDLAFATAKLGELGLDIDSTDLLGHVEGHARGIVVGSTQLFSAKLALDSKSEGLSLRVDADGQDASSGHVRVHGKPRLVEGRFLGLDGAIDEIDVSIAGTEWKTQHPSAVKMDLAQRAFELERLDLAADDQRLSLQGKTRGDRIESSLFEVKHFDFSRLAAVLSPGHVLPFSDLYAIALASGPFDDPEVHARASGETHGRSEKDLIHVAGQVEGQLVHRQMNAKAFVTIGGQKASASFEAPFPLRPNAPIHGQLDASVLLSPLFAELITPKLIQFQPLFMFALSGTVTAHATLDGTTSNPEVHAAARFINWELSGAHGGTGLSAVYKDKELDASFKTEVSSLPAGGGSGGGIIELTGKVPLDLGALLSGSDAALLPQHAPVHGVVNLKHVKVDWLPLRAFGTIPALQHGTLDGSMQIAGTYARPQLSTKFTASDFDWVRAGVGDIDAEVDAQLEGSAATIGAKLSIGGVGAMDIKGSIDAGREENPWHVDWRHAQMAIEGRTNKFDLSHLALFEGVDGLLDGKLRITGTVKHPYVTGDYDAPLLHIGEVGFKRFGVHGKLVDDRLMAFVKSEEQSGATLAAEVSAPVDDGPITASLEAHHFRVDLHGERLQGIRVLRGVLDGSLSVAGTTRGPSVRGHLTVEEGELGVTSTAMRYKDIALVLGFDDHQLKVERAEAHAGQAGVLKLHGTVEWAGLGLHAIDAQLSATKFPYQQQGVGFLLDGELTATGKEDKEGGLRGHIKLTHGAAQLPDLAQTRVLLPVGPIPDVRVVQDAKRDTRPGKHGLTIGALLDGPFVIKGTEVSARALGGLSVDLTGARPLLSGALRLDHGAWLDLFGRRYDIERGRISFDGTPMPSLDFRISRRTPAATIGVDVSGRANEPHLDFWSEPPSFDTTQIVGIILSGDPAATGVSPDGMQRQAVGAISSLLVSSIKQRFLPELPIDVLRFDASETSGASAVGSQIEVGKYLTESLYIGYAYQIGANREGDNRQNRNEARIDYRLPHNWQVEGDVGDAGTGGVDLYWTYRP